MRCRAGRASKTGDRPQTRALEGRTRADFVPMVRRTLSALCLPFFLASAAGKGSGLSRVRAGNSCAGRFVRRRQTAELHVIKGTRSRKDEGLVSARRGAQGKPSGPHSSYRVMGDDLYILRLMN